MNSFDAQAWAGLQAFTRPAPASALPADMSPLAFEQRPQSEAVASLGANLGTNSAANSSASIGAPASATRSIRSFVLRRGHITAAQQEAYSRLLPVWSLPYRPTALHLPTVFERDAPTFLEIGFGMGETTAQIAKAQPEHNFLCVDVFSSGVGALLKRIDQAGLTNIRIVQHDAVEVVSHMLAQASLSGIHIFFPDPWPKKRHHKRRLIQAPFVELLASRMQTHAYLHCATDWQHYADQMLEVLSAETQLRNRYESFAPRPDWRPMTKFEQRGLNLGNGVWDLVFTKQAANCAQA